MLLIVAIGTLAFIAMLVLGAYAPDLRSGHNGGSHALSNAATGFSGLVRLAEATGRNPLIVRSEDELKTEDLVVITPEHGWTDLSEILALRGPRATLIVLPKWETVPDKTKPGWVRVSGLLPPLDPGADARSAYFWTSTAGAARGTSASSPCIAGSGGIAILRAGVDADDQQSEAQAAGHRSVGPHPARPSRRTAALPAGRPGSRQQSRYGRRAPGQSSAGDARFPQQHGCRLYPRSTSRPMASAIRKARSSWRSIRRFLASR